MGRDGEGGTPEATVVPRGAPTPALPQRGREKFGDFFDAIPSAHLRIKVCRERMSIGTAKRRTVDPPRNALVYFCALSA